MNSPSATAEPTASQAAGVRAGTCERRSGVETATAPTSASPAPARARRPGRSPVASATVNGTSAPQAARGETMLIVPNDSAL